MATFTLTSPDIAEGRTIAARFVHPGAGGQNVSPALAWTDPPAGTKSFAVFCHDPDAPTGGAGFWHWAATEIPAAARGLSQGAGAAGALPTPARHWDSDYGDAAYGGPCPPPGPAHRYVFTVYALSVEKIDAPAGARTSLVGFLVNANTLAKASLTALFGQ